MWGCSSKIRIYFLYDDDNLFLRSRTTNFKRKKKFMEKNTDSRKFGIFMMSQISNLFNLF